MAKDEATKAIVAASTALITQLTMLTSALDTGAVDQTDFWAAYSDAIESFIPGSAEDDAPSPTPANTAQRETSEGQS